MINLYMDLDGVLCNFEKAYREMWHEFEYDRKRFKAAVLERSIFTNLEKMPGAEPLLQMMKYLRDNKGVNVEILTSTGSSDPAMIAAATQQKTHWLEKHGIAYKTNFVNNKPQKARFANKLSILVDDSIGCIDPFNAAGGYGVHHHHETVFDTKETVYNIIYELQNNQTEV